VNDRPPLEWKQVHELKGSDGLIVRIQRRGDIRPLYSLQIGHERRPNPDGTPDDRLLPFVRVKIQAQGTVSIDRSPEELVKKALDWVHEDAMQFEQNYTERRYDRDTSRTEKNGDMRRTGKTERNRNKKRAGPRFVRYGLSMSH